MLMALALGLQTLHNLREDQACNAERLGHAMATLMVEALRHDDVWLAYSLLRGPDGRDAEVVWIAVDDRGRILASNRPRRFRLDDPVREALPWLTERAASGGQQGAVREPGGDAARRLLRIPLYSDGTAVGELLALLSDAPFQARFREILLGGLLVTAAVLALLLPLGWLWGRRMVTPLVRLSGCLARVGRDDVRALDCPIYTGDDEIGQLGRRFTEMLDALAEKAALEQRMIQAERLAAVGRVAAGVAHEINNPLGGMVMAIDTYRARPVPLDEQTRQLLDFLGRALCQIQETVSALLVEARADSRTLTPADIEDVRTLVQPRLTRCGTTLGWDSAFAMPTTLPAAPVRQLLLNLLLNALEAARDEGTVSVQVAESEGKLRIEVRNSGQPLAVERLAHAFEPYPKPRAAGFGLWVCYQIASQLGGEIALDVDGPVTRARVCLPLNPGVAHG
jgi:signal transduction histidine kinase